jgi:hypothetical protein
MIQDETQNCAVYFDNAGSGNNYFQVMADGMGGGGDNLAFYNTVSMNAWHLVTLNVSSTLSVWVDGVHLGATTDNASNCFSSGSNVVIGNNYLASNAFYYFTGQMDDLALKTTQFTPTQIAGIYNSGSGAELLNSGGGGGSTALSFVFPVNGTTTPAFSNFILSGANLTSTDEYYVTVNYYIPQVSPVLTSQSVQLSGSQALAQGFVVSKSPFNINLGNVTAGIVANATLYDVTGFQVPDNLNNFVVATTTSIFTEIPNGNQSNQTTTYLQTTAFNSSGTIVVGINSVLNSSVPYIASSTSDCISVASSSNLIGATLAYGLCSAGQFLFTPQSNYTLGLTNAIESYQNVFPFSLYFSVLNGVIGSVNSSNVSTTSTLSMSVLGLNGSYINLGSLTSSTDVTAFTTGVISNDVGNVPACDTDCATEKVNNLFSILIMLIWLTCGLNLVRMVVKFNY